LNQYEILFKASKDVAYSQHLFMAVFIIRTYLFSLILSYLFDHPLAQAILINLAMLFYLIFKNASQTQDQAGSVHRSRAYNVQRQPLCPDSCFS